MISSQTLFTFDKQHFIPENGEKLVKCKVCNCSYKHEFSLKRHFLRTHVNRSYIPDSERTMLGEWSVMSPPIELDFLSPGFIPLSPTDFVF